MSITNSLSLRLGAGDRGAKKRGITEQVQFALPEGIYDSVSESPLSLTLYTLQPNAKIYYTTDGMTTDTSKTLYSEPISISATTTVKAVAIAPRYSISAETSRRYVLAAVGEYADNTFAYDNDDEIAWTASYAVSLGRKLIA